MISIVLFAALAAAPAPGAPHDLAAVLGDTAGATFSGDFHDTPVTEALPRVLEPARLSVIFAPGASGTVTAHFTSAPVGDAFQAVCEQAGLDAELHGRVVRVHVASAAPLAPVPPVAPVPPTMPVMPAAPKAPVPPVPPVAPAAPDDDEDEPESPNTNGGDRVLTGDIVVKQGEHAGSVVALGGSVHLEPGASARDVVALGGAVTVEPGAAIGGSAVGLGGPVDVRSGGSVRGEAVSVGGAVEVASGGHVGGQRSAVSLPFHVGHWHADAPSRPEPPPEPPKPLFRVGKIIGEFALYFALALVLVTFWPQRMERITSELERTPVRATAIGLFGAIALSVMTVMLVVGSLGLGLVAVPFEILAWVAATLFGFSALSLAVGRQVVARASPGVRAAQLAVGVAVVVLLQAVPYLGWLFTFVAWVVGFGAVLTSRFGSLEATPMV